MLTRSLPTTSYLVVPGSFIFANYEITCISEIHYFCQLLFTQKRILPTTMGDNRDSYLVKALLDNYEEPLDISLISNNPFIPSIGNNLNTPTNQNNEKRHLLPESTPNLPLTVNNKTPAKSKSIQELESFIDQKCNELALGSLKRDAEIKQQISDELEAHYNTSLVKSLKDQIDILQSEVYFLREELREKNNIFKILMKSKISDNKCYNIDNHKNISKNENDEKINENINNSMANTINFDSGNENNKNNGNKNKGNYINSNEGNSNNNNNSSSKERNMSSSNINSKINIKNINDNSKENNMNSNGGDNSTNSKQKQASNNTNSISNNNNNGNSKENNISSSNINSKTRKTAFIVGDSMVKKIDGYLLTSSINHRYIVK